MYGSLDVVAGSEPCAAYTNWEKGTGGTRSVPAPDAPAGGNAASQKFRGFGGESYPSRIASGIASNITSTGASLPVQSLNPSAPW